MPTIKIFANRDYNPYGSPATGPTSWSTMTSANMWIGTPKLYSTASTFRYCVNFDLSGIRAGSQINSIALSIHVQSSTNARAIQIGRYSNDLSRDIYDDGGAGTWQVMFTTGCGQTANPAYTTGWSPNLTTYNTITLGNQASIDAEEQITIGRKFNIFLRQTIDNNNYSEYRQISSKSSSNPPYITIDYTDPVPTRTVFSNDDIPDLLVKSTPRSGDIISTQDQLIPYLALNGQNYSTAPVSSGMTATVITTGQGGIDSGTYAYKVSFITYDLNSMEVAAEVPSAQNDWKEVTISSAQAPANIRLIAVDSPDATEAVLLNGRRIYRSKISATGEPPTDWGLVGTIYDTSTRFIDSKAHIDTNYTPPSRSSLGQSLTGLGQSVDFPVAPIWPEPVREIITTGNSYTVPSGKILAIQSLCTTATGTTTGYVSVNNARIFGTTGAAGSPHLLRPILCDSAWTISVDANISVHMIGTLMPRLVSPVVTLIGTESPLVRQRSDPPLFLTHVYSTVTADTIVLKKSTQSFVLMNTGSGYPTLIDTGRNPVARVLKLDGEYSIISTSSTATIIGYEENTG